MTHINVRDVLDSLSLAKEAYDAVPDLRRQIDDLQAALASKDRLLSQTQSNLEQTIAGKANVEAKLKQTEEERDQYGFRAIDAEEKLEKVFGVVKPAVAPVQPQPVTEPVGQSAADPTPVTETSSTNVATIAVPESTGQSAVPPTPVASTSTGTTEPIGDTEPVRSYSEELAKKAAEPLVNRPEDWGKAQSDSGDEDHVVVDKPYLGHPSWEKPFDMAWAEWESKGGTVPAWMKQHG